MMGFPCRASMGAHLCDKLVDTSLCHHQWELPDSSSIIAELIRGTGQGGGAAP